ncbi:MAG: hypothetical protein KF721_06130 [Ignavibacteriaceae bacterium]|nr:hypothetical protein [Ignavibacteriaceae bacterium]
MKIGVLDIGSNSFHFILGQIDISLNLKILERNRTVLRLNKFNAQSLNSIDTSDLQKALSIINNAIEICRKHNAELIVVATSAVRESKNKNEFINEIQNKLGIRINVLEGEEEAKLIYLGVTKQLNFSDSEIICNIDIGGGSTEIILGLGEKIIHASSVAVGAVRLASKYFPDYKINDEIFENANYDVSLILEDVKSKSEGFKPTKFIGSSGTFLAILEIIKKNNQLTHDQNFFNYDMFNQAKLKIYSSRTVKERMNINGVEERRADILPAGFIIVDSLFKTFGVEQFYVSTFSLREGVMIAKYLGKMNFC